MQWDYLIVRPEADFSEFDLGVARERLRAFPTHEWVAGLTFTLFPDENARSQMLPRLLQAPDDPDWLNGYIVLTSKYLKVGVVAERAILRHAYDFTRWAESTWPGSLLTYGGAEVDPTELLFLEHP